MGAGPLQLSSGINPNLIRGGVSEPQPEQDREYGHWYLAQLKPGGFERATLNLERQRFATFMPVREVSRRQRGRIRVENRPLFPGYLFVQIPPDRRNWQTINSTYGVVRLVALEAGQPTEVPRRLMEALRARIDTQGRLRPSDNLAVGSRVRIICGPFATHLAEIETIGAQDRVCLLMRLMGQTVRAQVQPQELEPL